MANKRRNLLSPRSVHGSYWTSAGSRSAGQGVESGFGQKYCAALSASALGTALESVKAQTGAISVGGVEATRIATERQRVGSPRYACCARRISSLRGTILRAESGAQNTGERVWRPENDNYTN